jgi:hypothetical protein
MHKQNERLVTNLHLHISPRVIVSVMAVIIAILTGISVASDVIRFRSGHRTTMTWWMAMFNLDREQNVSTFYQGITIFFCVLGLTAIGLHKWRQRDSFRFHWLGLAGIFLVLSLDEMCALHNQLETVMSRGGKQEYHGVWHYSWIIPGLGFVAVVGLAYLWFVFRLPRRTCIGMIVAGAIYVGGAVGMEMVGGWVADRYYGGNASENLACALLANLEEFMEMLGIAVFLFTLLNYKIEFVPNLSFEFANDAPRARRHPVLTRSFVAMHPPKLKARRVGSIMVAPNVRPRGARTNRFTSADDSTAEVAQSAQEPPPGA